MTSKQTILSKERRKSEGCRVPKEIQSFIKYWPFILGMAYLIMGVWPSSIFTSNKDTFYQTLDLLIAFFGVLSAIFWKKHFFRTIMTSMALGRAVSSVSVALFTEPTPSFSNLSQLLAAGCIAAIFFYLSIVEKPFIRAMRW